MLRSSMQAIRGFRVPQSTTSRFFQLPAPTWSLTDLNLTSSSEPISEEELKILASRACVDLDHIADTTRLRRDVSNMLHCMEHVMSIDLPDMTAEEIYDAPRRLTAAPVRKEIKATDEEKEEAKQVWKELLQCKTIKYGGHEYFAIDTMKTDGAGTNGPS
ncbi:hypothetical protein MHU86_19553 [Fragilaria crotonensis]|nr:hypothetical protein MHU86_19553 [Fragilaria crotonensis]